MKKIISIYSLLVFLSSVVCKISAQQLVYYQEDKLYTIELETRKKSSVKLEEKLVFDDSRLTKTDKTVYHPENLSEQLKLPDGNLFYHGLQSPYDFATWIYVERDMIGKGYRLWEYNTNSGLQKLLFENTGGPDPELQFIPIGWSNDKNIIYLEAIDHFDSENLHEGIYSYHIKNNRSQKLAIRDHYMATPLLSPDRKIFAYSASFESGKNRDLLHGKSERILTYSLLSNKEKVIVEEKETMLSFAGWTNMNTQAKELLIDEKKINYREKSNSQIAKAAVSLKLPWSSGISYCISRHGTPAPTGAIGSSSRCNIYNFNSHGYVAIDVDTPNSVLDYITASAAGTVTFARKTDQGGYGKYVIVTHNDNTQTLYAHLNQVYVNVGDCIGQGNSIGDGGTTGNSSGDHLHFEKRVGSTKVYPVFSECGCTPRQDYRYTSGNQRTTGCGPPCEPERTVSGTINSGTYTSSSTIIGKGVINAGSTVVFETKNEIYLDTGFEAKNNSIFETRLGGGCSSARSFEVADLSMKIPIEQDFKVHPNPSQGIIYIDGINKNDILSLYDLSGRLLIKKVASETKELLDIKHLLQGLYIVKVGDKPAKRVFKAD